MTTKTLAIVLAFGAAAYVLTRKAGSGNSILGSFGSLFGSSSGGVDIPTNGTLAGTLGWDGSPNNSSTSYGSAEYGDSWELGSIFGTY